MIQEKYSTNLLKTKYVNDARITDHYAIIPTGQDVKKGDYLAMSAKSIVASDQDIDAVLEKIYDLILSQKKKDLLTIIVGEDGKENITNQIVEFIEDNSKLEVSVIQGNQPVYSYLFGLE